VRSQIEGSAAVARAVALCRPEVICAYPISPQTHIVEGLSDRVRTGELAPCEYLMVESEMMTGYAGIFAAGDMVPAERTVTVAIGQGKKAARNIDAWLRASRYEAPPKHELAEFDRLNTWYFTDAPRSVQPQLELARRQSTFEEVVGGLNESTALYEARRCLSCGNCFSCDNCYGVCPDNAVIKLTGPGERYAIDYDFCKGCGICVDECPCGAIDLVPETI
jgi:2-oxoacid:acceptor oxidoreductase delta subunit (pyruvate/2-ketoisovalerate family)